MKIVALPRLTDFFEDLLAFLIAVVVVMTTKSIIIHLTILSHTFEQQTKREKDESLHMIDSG